LDSSNSVLPSKLDLDAKFKRANTAYEDGLLVEAEKWFLNIVVEHPNLADAWFKLGNIYYRSGRYAAAVRAYEKVLGNDSTYEKAWYNLALTRVSQSVEVIDESLEFIDHNSPYFKRTLELKERLINRFAQGGNVSTTGVVNKVKKDKEPILVTDNSAQRAEENRTAVIVIPVDSKPVMEAETTNMKTVKPLVETKERVIKTKEPVIKATRIIVDDDLDSSIEETKGIAEDINLESSYSGASSRGQRTFEEPPN